jgi:transcriptional regulator with XRE-family HTH domain
MKIERVNIGEIIRKKIEERGSSFASFAKSIGIQRQNLEKTVFGKKSIDTDMLSEISEKLDFDFFQYYRCSGECNKNDYTPNEVKKIKAFIALQVGEERKEETLTFSFGKGFDS